ncbi:hypothetical protein C2I36_00675 [Rhodobacteraceae bacterium WD3A24]|nr:hypothetical protein C2I36_00675 [Rhodobacteraceae bacterium WD3A24]
MRHTQALIALAAFATAGLLAVLAAIWAAGAVERHSAASVSESLTEAGNDWAEIDVDGLLVTLTGTAPSEAARFRALSLAGDVVDSARVIDRMDVAEGADVAPPRFSIELLRNDEDISLIGLIPMGYGRTEIIDRLTALGEEMAVADMLESANHPAPAGWDASVQFGLEALERVEAARVSISAGRVSVTALSDSPEAKRELEERLRRRAPQELELSLDISAPRPVITPFTLRFVIDEGGAHFDACSADTADARARIITAAREAGVTGEITCRLGLGVPSPNWARAAELSIEALARLGAGTVTLSDADIALVVPHDVSQDRFDTVAGELEGALPEVFSLDAVLRDPPEEPREADPEAQRFSAELSEDGAVVLRGRVTDEAMREAANSYAQARFGTGAVQMATRLDDTMPEGWPLRVLTGIEALAELHHGRLDVRPEAITLAGVSGNPDASDQVSRILTGSLGGEGDFTIDVTYDEELDPVAQQPTPESCVADINGILEDDMITFEPGSDELDGEAAETLDAIAEVLRGCGELSLEVAGHTDSQGRSEMNRALSRARAEAVISALMNRRVLVSQFEARGYGEQNPVASNDTPEGREANRRIEFNLLVEAETVDGVLQRDPELEATLEFSIRTPNDNTPRPRMRPADAETTQTSEEPEDDAGADG